MAEQEPVAEVVVPEEQSVAPAPVVDEVGDAEAAPAPVAVEATVSAPVEAEGAEEEDERPSKKQRSESNEAVAVEAPAVPAAIDADALLSALEEDPIPELEAEAKETPAPPAPVVDPYEAVTWSEIFGDIPRHQIFPPVEEEGDEVPEDPEAHDIYNVLRQCFGEKLSENDVVLYEAADALREATGRARIDQSMETIDQCFGFGCRALLADPATKLVPPSIRVVRKPKNNLRAKNVNQRILVEMPTMQPNRQYLHCEPEKYDPTLDMMKNSTPRALYTPQNIMRWAYMPSSNKKLSNARLVTWSDGTSTIHVGGDVYETVDTTEQALHMVARSSYDEKTGETVAVESVPVDRHFVVRAAAGVPNSVEAYIQHQSNEERKVEMQSRVPVPINQLPDFNVAKDKNPPRKTERSMEEEFVNMRRQLREKNLKGNASLTDHLMDEIETLRLLEAARKDAGQGGIQQLINECESKLKPVRKSGVVPGYGSRRNEAYDDEEGNPRFTAEERAMLEEYQRERVGGAAEDEEGEDPQNVALRDAVTAALEKEEARLGSEPVEAA